MFQEIKFGDKTLKFSTSIKVIIEYKKLTGEEMLTEKDAKSLGITKIAEILSVANKVQTELDGEKWNENSFWNAFQMSILMGGEESEFFKGFNKYAAKMMGETKGGTQNSPSTSNS